MITLDWKVVDEAARDLGVRESALKKWRQRGVPHKWRLPLIETTKGKITAEAFKEETSDA